MLISKMTVKIDQNQFQIKMTVYFYRNGRLIVKTPGQIGVKITLGEKYR